MGIRAEQARICRCSYEARLEGRRVNTTLFHPDTTRFSSTRATEYWPVLRPTGTWARIFHQHVGLSWWIISRQSQHLKKKPAHNFRDLKWFQNLGGVEIENECIFGGSGRVWLGIQVANRTCTLAMTRNTTLILIPSRAWSVLLDVLVSHDLHLILGPETVEPARFYHNLRLGNYEWGAKIRWLISHYLNMMCISTADLGNGWCNRDGLSSNPFIGCASHRPGPVEMIFHLIGTRHGDSEFYAYCYNDGVTRKIKVI